MRSFLALSAILGGILICASTNVFAIPSPPKVPMRAFNDDVVVPVNRLSFSAGAVDQGNDVKDVLSQIASSLNQGLPDRWERLMHEPITQGSSTIDMIASSDLESVVRSWGLDDELFSQAYHDINTMIRLAVGEGVYIAQGFSYNWAPCPGGGEHPACLSTLIVVVRVPYVPGAGSDSPASTAELGHIYVTSTAETVQQYDYSHPCHRCWFKRCCHDVYTPRNLDTPELQDVQAAISTFQSNWALNLLSQQTRQAQPSLYSAGSGTSLSSASDTAPVWPSLFDRLLRRFIGNSAENRDVHKVYRGGLLEAIQNATLFRRQAFHNMQLTVSERGIVPLLEDMLTSCFDRANIEESVEEWWRRVYAESRSDPISLECEFVIQRRVTIVPPRDRCIASANVTTNSSYSWILVAPHDNGLFEILFMEGDLGVAFEECKPEEEDDDEEVLDSWTTLARIPMNIQESGSMVRWGYVNSNDGSFGSMQYLAEWESYPSHVSKVLLDFLRFASASSYLKIPVYKRPLSPPSLSPSPCPHRHPVLQYYQQQQLQLQDASTNTVAPLAMDQSFVALMESIKMFAETWEKLAKAIGSTISTNIMRRVCLGFDALDYRATSSVMQGVAQKNLAELVEDVVDLEELPRREDIKRLMTGVKYSTNFTWLAESMTFTNPAGESSYFFFAKYGGDGSTDMANVVYTAIKSKFALAPDMLIVRRQKSSWFGFSKSDETSIEYVPHTLTLNDTLVLEMFCEMVAFHQLAISLGVDPPMYPDLSGYCDRSIP
ncbi:hypothetical protein BGZ99_002904 [Dissophora globulifera]|uniref:Membrane-associated protein n=1 Tax=Dissophora globulifera TaxID=979702 RepID=A0A9P6RQW9_9FUNG|nr:hypothetical protein BGZ99_002904 [Dissophora globulifera]